MAKKLSKKTTTKPVARKGAAASKTASKQGAPARKTAAAAPSKVKKAAPKAAKPASRGPRAAAKPARSGAPKGGKQPGKSAPKTAARKSATGKLRSEMRAAGAMKQPAVNAGATAQLTPRQAHRKLMMEEAKAFAIETARMLHDDRCEDIVVIEIASASQMCDYIVIGSGTSDRQMRGVGDDVDKLGKEMGFNTSRRNVDDRTTWLLIDFGGVIVHLFEPNARAFYDLEMMWGDAPKIEWARPAGSRPPIRRSAAAAVQDPAPAEEMAAEDGADGAADDLATEATDIQ